MFQDVVTSLCERKQKVYVAFLDVRKAFDTVWHAGLMVKLFQNETSLYIWHVRNSWYNCLSSAVLWNSSISPLSNVCISGPFSLLSSALF